MILESLKALSEVRQHRVSFKELSLEIDENENKLFLTKMFGSGRTTPRAVTLRLLEVLTNDGVNPKHMAFQWAELYLNTRGLTHINFDYYLRELTTVSDHTPATTSQISHENRLMAKSIMWGLTAGRSWWSGEKMSYDETTLHHIRHDGSKTLYGGTYETLQNFAAISSSENQKVEGANLQLSITIFISMWELFKQGKFREATMHWDKIHQDAFIKEINSKRYLKYWMSKI